MLSSGGRWAGWLNVDGGPQRVHGLVAFVERAMLASDFKGGRALSCTCIQGWFKREQGAGLLEEALGGVDAKRVVEI